MRIVFSLIITLTLSAALPAWAVFSGGLRVLTDSTKPDPAAKPEEFRVIATGFQPAVNTTAIQQIAKTRSAFRGELGYSKKGNAIYAYYFPGKSERRALIIGGVHGSELSGIEVARKLVEDLKKENDSYYSLIIIPCLFPDNEWLALQPVAKKGKKEKVYNQGRYTHKDATDPNRQMPGLGKPFDFNNPFDYLGRNIENENQVLLQLIEEFRPERIANLHAIRDIRHAGIFADPRTDHEGFALGFDTDSSLAIEMAKYIYEHGGNVAGNRLDSTPTALYFADPPVVNTGEWQPRNLKGSAMNGDRGQGISLGSWASTAVCDSVNEQKRRHAIRLITVEFPGYSRPSDYASLPDQQYHKELVNLYATAIKSIFLGRYFEEDTTNGCDCIRTRGDLLTEK